MSKTPLKKLAIAAAVSSAIGAMGAAEAVILGVPGNGQIATFVEYNSASDQRVNTLIGVTIPDEDTTSSHNDIGSDFDGDIANQWPNGWNDDMSNTCDDHSWTDSGAVGTSINRKLIHWWFFDKESSHIVNDNFTVSREDFYPFDWGAIVEDKFPALDGVRGYIVFADEEVWGDARDQACIFLDTIRIEGNWESAAFIPNLALRNEEDSGQETSPGNEEPVLTFDDHMIFARGAGTIPSAVNPIGSGMWVNNGKDKSEQEDVVWDMRYFINDDTSLGVTGDTKLVVWLPFNDSDRVADVTVYDTGEGANSASIPLPYELNVIDVTPTSVSGTGWNYESECSKRTVDECRLLSGNMEGFIVFYVPEMVPENASGNNVSQFKRDLNYDDGELAYDDGTNTSDSYSTPIAGIAYSLIGLNTDGNPNQVQTMLGHERGMDNFLD